MAHEQARAITSVMERSSQPLPSQQVPPTAHPPPEDRDAPQCIPYRVPRTARAAAWPEEYLAGTRDRCRKNLGAHGSMPVRLVEGWRAPVLRSHHPGTIAEKTLEGYKYLLTFYGTHRGKPSETPAAIIHFERSTTHDEEVRPLDGSNGIEGSETVLERVSWYPPCVMVRRSQSDYSSEVSGGLEVG